MKPFDVDHFSRRLLQARAARDWTAIEQLDEELASILMQPAKLSVAEVSQLQTLYQQMLREIGRAMQHSEQELAQYLQQREQRMAYAAVAGDDDA